MSAEEEEEEIQQPFVLPTITNDYFRPPVTSFPGAPTFPGHEVYFDPDNIFYFSGHGREETYLQLGDNTDIMHRYKLRRNQYALIPGKCGNILIAEDEGSFEDFFKSTKPIKVFNSSTTNSNVGFSSSFFKSSPKNKNRETVPLSIQSKEGQLKFYYPKTKNSNSIARVSLPPLLLNPLLYYINKDNTELTLYISGLLRKSQPYNMGIRSRGLFSSSTPIYGLVAPITKAALQLELAYFTNPPGETFKYYKPINFTEKDVKLAKGALSLIEKSLSGSVLTFKNLVAMAIIYNFGNYTQGYAPISQNNMYELTQISMDEIMARTQMDRSEKTGNALRAYNSLRINDILHFNIPIAFIYKFLDSKTNNKPYVVLIPACRGLKLKNVYLDEGETKQNLIARRRALSNATAPSATEAAGGGGGGGGGAAGGTRRRRRIVRRKSRKNSKKTTIRLACRPRKRKH